MNNTIPARVPLSEVMDKLKPEDFGTEDD